MSKFRFNEYMKSQNSCYNYGVFFPKKFNIVLGVDIWYRYDTLNIIVSLLFISFGFDLNFKQLFRRNKQKKFVGKEPFM